MEEERRYDEERDQGKRLVHEQDEGEQYQGVTAKTGRSDERDTQFQKKKSDENLYVIRIRLDLSRTWSQKEGKKRKSWKFRQANLSPLARPVPLSTYVTPAQLQDYRRSRCASRRSVRLLVDANSPPLNNEHAVRSNISNKVRHILCIEGSKERKHPRPPIPDFHRLHAEVGRFLAIVLQKEITSSHKNGNFSANPHHPLVPKQDIRANQQKNRFTYALHTRQKLEWRPSSIQREQKLFEERHKSEKFWEGKKEEMDLSRLKLLSSMGSYGNIQEEIERKTAEKRQI
ncbi:hypothetical protein NECAME_13675 [Necator americanus]|uniref:Uncharacterized protein n=1 Tax=Necator americanus TaxID=51031 RepID=W2SW67_NECAM|nr:hypothetical protein NECAME_13675 [Necator americanus]ETN72947.1 hypothetical protein NECAME_13675 [Necator americanus]